MEELNKQQLDAIKAHGGLGSGIHSIIESPDGGRIYQLMCCIVELKDIFNQ